MCCEKTLPGRTERAPKRRKTGQRESDGGGKKGRSGDVAYVTQDGGDVPIAGLEKNTGWGFEKGRGVWLWGQRRVAD